MRSFRFTILFLTIVLAITNLSFGQTKKSKTTKKTTKPVIKATPTPPTSPVEETNVKTDIKKNERPAEANSTNEPQKTNQSTKTNSRVNPDNPVYFYEFSQPNFMVAKVFIEHDEAGKGKITFMKQDFQEEVSDPIQLSPATLEKIKTAFSALNFLASNENYQDEKRNYSHLGELKIKMKKDGRERTAAFNWTENKDAKLLADEYRKISQQYVWMFDINVSRQNQPLQAPSLMDTLDGYLRRSEISDPPQMIPFLKKLSDDERIPLIARNHATRMIKEIEKKAEKDKQ